MKKDTYVEATELLFDLFGSKEGGTIRNMVSLNEIRAERRKRGISKRDLKLAKNHWLLDTVEINGEWYWRDHD